MIYISIDKRNYMLFVDRVSQNFASQCWSDGYNDVPDDSENIVKQLYKKITISNLIECVNLYLQGYEVSNIFVS